MILKFLMLSTLLSHHSWKPQAQKNNRMICMDDWWGGKEYVAILSIRKNIHHRSSLFLGSIKTICKKKSEKFSKRKQLFLENSVLWSYWCISREFTEFHNSSNLIQKVQTCFMFFSPVQSSFFPTILTTFDRSTVVKIDGCFCINCIPME